MATAFNAYKPPEHGLVYFVFSNLVPTNKDSGSQEESSRTKHTELDMATNTMEEANNKMQKPDDRAELVKGQGSQRFGY